MVRKRYAIRMQMAAMAAMVMTSTAGAGAQAGARGSGRAAAPVFSADVVIDEAVVDEQGQLVEARPQTRYRMSVHRAGGGLQTEIVYPEARLFPKGPLADPRSGYRIVVGGDLAGGRVYDAAGALVAGPPEPPAGDADPGTTADPGLVLSDRDVAARRNELVRRFGPALGRIAGRDRYLVSDGDRVTETLVEPATMLPVEINVARGGALEHRTSIAYGRMPRGRWYVASMRSEMALPGGTGRRFVSSRTHHNVVSQEVR
jgi:hypothetical protein